jgi:polyribonucleotide nucleotidyltransferase
VNRVEDILHLGDRVTVKVISIDPDGKIRLSRKALLPKKQQPHKNRKPSKAKRY